MIMLFFPFIIKINTYVMDINTELFMDRTTNVLDVF